MRKDAIAKWTFRIAGVYGLVVLVPLLFSREQFGQTNPPAISHPEFFYGFLGVAISWQVAFILISLDPTRLRMMMIPAVLEKWIFGSIVLYLHFTEGVNLPILQGAVIDCILGAAFIVSYLRTPQT